MLKSGWLRRGRPPNAAIAAADASFYVRAVFMAMPVELTGCVGTGTETEARLAAGSSSSSRGRRCTTSVSGRLIAGWWWLFGGPSMEMKSLDRGRSEVDVHTIWILDLVRLNGP